MTLRHFLADDDLTAAEQAAVLDLADALKADPYKISPLAGPRSVALLFDKPTLRTQTSFSAGIAELGGFPMIVDGRLAGIGERESVADTARVLGRQCAAIVWRTFAPGPDRGDGRVRRGAGGQRADRPATTRARCWPTCMTIREHRGRLAGLTLAYVGDGANNMAHSYLLGGRAGRAARPDRGTAGVLSRTRTSWPGPRRWPPRPAAACWSPTSAAEAVAGADVVATDTWVSMGNENDGRDRSTALRPVRGDRRPARRAAPDAIVLHCLPAYRGKEIAADVLDGPQSVVWDEAENRRHVQKAMLAFLLDADRAHDQPGRARPDDHDHPTTDRADQDRPAGQDHRAAGDP